MNFSKGLAFLLTFILFANAADIELKQFKRTTTNKEIAAHLEIHNNKSTSVSVRNLVVYYYFYEASLTPANMHYVVDYFNPGGSNYNSFPGTSITFTSFTDNNPVSGKRCNLIAKIKFSENLSIPSHDYATVEPKFYKDQSYVMTESDDYSFRNSTSLGLNYNTVVCDTNGTVLFGTPPTPAVSYDLELSFNGQETSNSGIRITVPGQSPVTYTSNTTIPYTNSPTIFIEAVPLNGKKFDSWIYDGAPLYSDTLTVTMSSDHYLSVFFSRDYIYPNQISGPEMDMKVIGKAYIDDTLKIGTQNASGAGLFVKGNIKAKEITVTNIGWADYVFKQDLLPLSEVKKYIDEYGRLPGIPSEKEVALNGIGLGDMQSRLLAKIEELTLYILQMERKNEELVGKIEVLEKKVK